MKWSDIKDGVWVINVEAREKGTASVNPIADHGTGGHRGATSYHGQPVLVCRKHGVAPFNAFSNGMTALRDVLPRHANFSMHDLRRTSRKLMTRAHVRPDVAELAIGHSLQGLQKIYDDVHEYQPMIDAAFQSVADEIAKVLNPRTPT